MAIASINYATIIQVVVQWPPDQRVALIHALLDTLKTVPTQTLPPPRLYDESQNIAFTLSAEVNETEWRTAAAHNPAFAFYTNP